MQYAYIFQWILYVQQYENIRKIFSTIYFRGYQNIYVILHYQRLAVCYAAHMNIYAEADTKILNSDCINRQFLVSCIDIQLLLRIHIIPHYIYTYEGNKGALSIR